MGQVKRFSFKELQAATDNFSNKNILGKGGFGNVYKGRLADGSWVAVKRMKEQRMQGGESYFQKEVQMISMAAHRNLLRLSGFCMTPKERLLVYPYMANGSVASRLNKDRPPNQPPLDWPIRKRIALGSARGLSYLHDDCDPKIIHHDVKASNVFLDEKFEAVIGDISSMDYSDTYVMTAGCGTFGHIAPKYFSTGNVSEKTDVFGYGIMLLELITGQRAFDLSRLADDGDVMLLDWVKKLLITGQRVFDLPRLANDGDVMLLDWVKGLLKDKKLVLDPDLETNYVASEVEELIQVAFQCTQGSPMNRPKMSDVVRTLQGNRLPERWDKWQKREVLQTYLSPLPNSVCILDSTHNLQAVELSGPR